MFAQLLRVSVDGAAAEKQTPALRQVAQTAEQEEQADGGEGLHRRGRLLEQQNRLSRGGKDPKKCNLQIT